MTEGRPSPGRVPLGHWERRFPAGAPVARLDSVGYSFDGGSSWALRDVSLEIGARERVCLMGANGSGKSTLALLLAGLRAPDEGSVELMGLPCFGDGGPDGEAYRAARRQAGLVLQDPQDQIVTTVVADDVAFGPENLGLAPEVIAGRVERELDRVAARDLAEADPTRLSGGQTQRVAIAGAMAMEPSLMVFDEATAFLDVRGAAALRRVTGRLDAVCAQVWVSHRAEDAEGADRLVVLDHGRVVYDGEPGGLLGSGHELEGWGLEPPFWATVADRLRGRGVELDSVSDESSLVEALAFRRRKPSTAVPAARDSKDHASNQAGTAEHGLRRQDGDPLTYNPKTPQVSEPFAHSPQTQQVEEPLTHSSQIQQVGEPFAHSPQIQQVEEPLTLSPQTQQVGEPLSYSSQTQQVGEPPSGSSGDFQSQGSTTRRRKPGSAVPARLDSRSLESRTAGTAEPGLRRQVLSGGGHRFPGRSENAADEVVWQARDLGFAYDGKAVLAGVDLDVRRGERVALVGATGSGKTTLARMLAGLVAPTKGRLSGLGVNLADRKGRRRVSGRIGFVMQRPERQLFADTVAEDVAFGPRNLVLSEAEVERRVGAALERLHISQLADRSPFALSGGQQRLAALAGVLALEPEVWVLDEPLAGLDATARQAIEQLLRELSEEGHAVVLVTHDMDQAARADHVLVLDHGSVVANGSPNDVFAREEQLERVGLGLPRPLALARKLADRGLDLGAPLTESELVDALVAHLALGADES